MFELKCNFRSMKYSCFLCLIAVLATFSWAGQARATALSDFNLIVLGDLSGTSEVEGSVAVFGDITGYSSMNFATKEATSTTGQNDNDGLIVGGQILTTNAIQVNNGNVRVGGSDTGTQVNNAPVTYNDATVASILSGVKADIDNLTTMLSGLTANSSFEAEANSMELISSVGLENIAVFDIDIDLYASLNPNLFLTGDDADLYVIRVGGTDVNIGSTWNTDALAAYQNKIIWYFYEAETLSFDRVVQGSVIAPNAELTNANYIAGTVVVDTMNLTGEIHLSTLVTPPSNPVPEPASFILLGMGSLIFGLKRRKFKKQS